MVRKGNGNGNRNIVINISETLYNADIKIMAHKKN